MAWVKNNLLADERSNPNAVRHKTVTRESKHDELVKQYAAIERKKKHAAETEMKLKEDRAELGFGKYPEAGELYATG